MKKITLFWALAVFLISSCTPKTVEKVTKAAAKETVEDVADNAENAAEEAIEVVEAEKPKVDRSLPMEEEAAEGDETTTKLKIYNEGQVDLGTIEYGDSVVHTFKYKNIGNIDFFIEQYTVGCGCTEIAKPKKRIAPGETGEITLQFNSKEKDGPGDYTSDVLLICNVAEGFLEFGMKVKVVEKKQ